MADPIDRQALYEKTAKWEAGALDMVKKLSHSDAPGDVKELLKWMTILGERTAFKHDVADAPSIRLERKTGRWKGEGMGDYRCSLCGVVGSGRTNFCPNCGADMGGGKG